MDVLGKLFNWRKHPASVFFIAGPLALTGFGLVGVRAVLELWVHGDPWYLVILGCSLALLGFGLWPIRRWL